MPANHQHRSLLCRIVGIELSSTKAAAARTVTVDVIARWDVDNNSGLGIGNQGTSDASSYMISTNVALVPPPG
ncbi:hypothetical protein CO676_22845 [Sinorhizobium sp. BJ1]|nr:hypothetical protein CO676_22845 [Sinorhizobium sp. BJ1]